MMIVVVYGMYSYNISVVMEYADGGDLLHHIKKHREKSIMMKEDSIWSIFLQILLGVSSLHRHKIVHRDIKVVMYNTVC